MDSTAQIDFSREEVPAGQAVQAANQLTIPASLTVPSEDEALSVESRSQRRSSRGAIASTFQIRSQRDSADRLSVDPVTTASKVLKDELFGESDNTVELQPVDRGFGAWSYVTAAFSMYIVVWGFPQAFPIFQTYLSNGPKARFPDSVAIRLLAPGLQDIEEGIMFPWLPTSPRFRRPLVLLGIFVMAISMLLASYAEKDWQVVLAQGMSFGVGGILLNFVHVSIFSEWFDKKKGRAMGIIWMGWRVGALAFPLVCQWLLDQSGFEQTLRVLIAPMLSLLVPSVFLLRGRYHSATLSMQPTKRRISKTQALTTPSVLYYLCATCLFYLVVNVPRMFITTFAADLGLRSTDQALTLVVLVLSDMMGTYLCGHVSDLIYHEGLTSSLAIGTALSHILGLGLARSKAGVLLYAIAVGLASGGFSNCLFTFFGDAAKGNGDLFTAIHGLFSLFRGAAILSVGPVGAELLRRAPNVDLAGFAIGRYKYLLAYSSSLSFASGLLIGVKYWKRRMTKILPKSGSNGETQ